MYSVMMLYTHDVMCDVMIWYFSLLGTEFDRIFFVTQAHQ